MKPVRLGTRPRSRPAIEPAVFFSLAMMVAGSMGGCSESEMPVAGRVKTAHDNAGADKVVSSDSLDKDLEQTKQPATASATMGPQAPAASKSATTAPAPAPAILRKIIYDARIDLLVKSLSVTERAILDLIQENGGFLAESTIAAQTGTQRDATWRARVPVNRFDSFVSAVSRLGEVRTNHVGSQDVTEEYYDIEARIRNKQEEEKRLLKHLADSTGKLEDILSVERELTRVRGEIEQMQGRLRFLANRAELSTVTITATEWKDYTPPVAMTLQAQLGHTFFGSLNALSAFGKSLLLVLVALVPWIPFIAVGLFVMRWAVRSTQRTEAKRRIAYALASRDVVAVVTTGTAAS